MEGDNGMKQKERGDFSHTSLEEGAGATELRLQGLHLWLDNQRNFLSQTRISPDTSSDFSVPGDIQAKGLAQGFYRSHFFIEGGRGIEPNDIWDFFPQIYDYAIV